MKTEKKVVIRNIFSKKEITQYVFKALLNYTNDHCDVEFYGSDINVNKKNVNIISLTISIYNDDEDYNQRVIDSFCMILEKKLSKLCPGSDIETDIRKGNMNIETEFIVKIIDHNGTIFVK